MSALAQYKFEQLDEPNVTIPLPSSYNERGINGVTTIFTNGRDQRKINSFYEVAQNSETGNKTVYLTKRPGCIDSGNTITMFAGEEPFLAVNPSLVATAPWVITSNASTIRACTIGSLGSIFSDGSNTWYPTYVDTFILSGTATVIVTARRSASVAMRSFYATAIGSWTEIVDANFSTLIHRGKMENIDGWSLQLADDNKIYNSALNTVSSWPAGNTISKQIQQDVAAGLAKLGSTVLAFGDNTVEGFRNAGSPALSPLVRIPELNQRIGLGTLSGNSGTIVSKRHYSAVLGNKLYFVGRSAGGAFSMSLYSFDGQRFDKISPSFIDKIFAANAFYHITAFSFFGKSAIAIALDVDTATTQRWLMYFPEWNDWFEWNSTYIQPVNAGEYFIGIANTSSYNKISLFTPGSSDTWLDGVSDPYTMTHQFRIPKNSNSRWTMDWAGVVADTAASTTTSNLSCEFSDDGGATFGSSRNIDLTKDKKHIYRCGGFRDRLVRLKHTANLECRLQSFISRIEK